MDSVIDPNLGVRARRSKNPRSSRREPTLRSPLVDHSLDEDLPHIREYAKKYADVDERMRQVLELYVFKNKTLDYYYGSYVTAYQAFTMAFTANNEIAFPLMSLVYMISHRIVETMKAAADAITSAEELPKKQIL